MTIEVSLRRSATGLGTQLRAETPVLAFLGAVAGLIVIHQRLPEASAAQDLLFIIFSGIALIALVIGILWNHPVHRTAWWLLAAGQLGIFVGDLVWTVEAWSGAETGIGTLPDAVYLTAYPLRIIGLYLMVRPRYDRGVREGLFDVTIVAVAIAAVSWFAVVEPLLHAAGPDPGTQLAAVIYPVLDLFLMSVAVAYVLAPGPRSVSFLLLLGGLVATLVADVAYTFLQLAGTYQYGGLLDAGWMLAGGLLAAAVLHSSVRTPDPPPGHARLDVPRRVMLTGALLTGPALLVLAPPDDASDLVVVAATIGCLSLLVLSRLLGVTRRLDADLVQRRALEARLEHQASHDPLTGLPNRRAFFERLAAVANRAGARRPPALLFVDVDDLKEVNDSLGHEAGDTLLAAIADRLRVGLRPGDLVARLGGDEFALLIEDVSDQAAAEAMADRLQRAIREPVPFGTTTVAAHASIGVVVQDGTVEGTDDLLRAADLAMYRAKATGKGRSVSFAPTMHAQAVQRLELRRDLGYAVTSDQIVLEYQPVVDLASSRISRLEALVRWNHPRYGRLAPDAFLGIAEEAGLIRELGRRVLQQACAEVAALDRRHPSRVPVALSINVALGQLLDPAFAAIVEDTLAVTGLPPERLVLEVSDGDLGRSREVASSGLARLRRHGVRLAIDDFGGANASIGLLRSIDVDELKLDRTLVADLDRTGAAADLALAKALIDIGVTLGIDTVAVGVERHDQLSVLHALGCRAAQGFLFSAPVPPGHLTTLLDAGSPLGLPSIPTGRRAGDPVTPDGVGETAARAPEPARPPLTSVPSPSRMS